MTLPMIRLIGAACLACVFCAGCGRSPASGNPTTGRTEADAPSDTAIVARRGQTPSSSVAVVTLHVKDMGTKLNLL